MRAFFVGLLVGACAAVAPAVAAVGLGAQGEFDAFLGQLTWKSTCQKPYVGLLRSEPPDRFEVELYVACLKRQARADADYAATVIAAGVSKAVDDLAAGAP